MRSIRDVAKRRKRRYCKIVFISIFLIGLANARKLRADEFLKYPNFAQNTDGTNEAEPIEFDASGTNADASSSSATPYRCAMRGICARDGEMTQNCEYDGPPMPVPIRNDHAYRELCPQLFANGNIAVCCNDEQFQILRRRMTIPQQLLSRCPSCYSNFVNFWCQFTCSPTQYNFVNVLEVRNASMLTIESTMESNLAKSLISPNRSNARNATIKPLLLATPGRPYVARVEYFVNAQYVRTLFESCRNVRTSNGDYVMGMMCGTNVENCSPEKLFKFLGTYNKAINVPFTIDVHFNESSMTFQSRIQALSGTKRQGVAPMNASAYPCNASSDISDYGCACVDCLASCVSSAPFPILFEESCKLAMMDCSTAMGVVAMGVLTGTAMLAVVLHYVLRHYTAEDFGNGVSTLDYDNVALANVFHQHQPDLTKNKQLHCVSAQEGHLLDPGSAENETLCINGAKWFVGEQRSLRFEERLICACAEYGRFVTNNYGLILLLGLIPSILASLGIYTMRLTTDPVELWSSTGSVAREQRDFFNENLTPFYRTEHFIIVPRDQSPVEREDSKNFLSTIEYGPIYRKKFLEDALELYLRILSLNVTTPNGEMVLLKDVCFKPLYPENDNCAVYSIFNYFQNNESNLHIIDESGFNTYDYLDHLEDCIANPYTMDSRIKRPCLSEFGAPIPPYVVLGDFSELQVGREQTKMADQSPQYEDEMKRYKRAHGLVNVILVNNFVNTSENEKALAWEHAYLRFMRSVESPSFTISFMSERSLEDEIERQSSSDALTVILSYAFMFIYVAIALGQYQITDNQFCSLFVNSKFVLGICGILSVTLSVTSSIGLFALYGMPASLLILEVEPFLVLAVGVDNIFIFVQFYQRLREDVDRPLEERIALICSEVMPSMLLSSLSECLCFCFGGLSEMPAVRAFSLYAALAIFLNFFLQITVFLAVFVWDIRRQETGRLELCCCVQICLDTLTHESFLYRIFKRYYAPNLLKRWVRSFVILFFLGWLTSSILVVSRVKIGLDQKIAVPEDSYVLTHFINMERFLSVGPIVYFVLRGVYDFEAPIEQSLICASVGCSARSLGAQLATAAKYPERSFIAHPAMNWLDDYVDWLKPVGVTQCCRKFIANNSFCSPNVESKGTCRACDVSFVNGKPQSSQFYQYLPDFLRENPSMKCAKAGHAAYGSAVRLQYRNETAQSFNRIRRDAKVVASHFMTYHTVLRTSEDYIKAMESAMIIAQNVTRDINAVLRTLQKPLIEIFPYSPFYVFYEQYKDIVRASIVQIVLSLTSIFCVSAVLLGGDPWSALIIVVLISMILMNVVGVMYWWTIDFNAISVVNLVMSVGISVEFCAHIVRAFTISVARSRIERAREALSNVGYSVLSGITITKLGGIVVLAFAHSQIFNVYYFRMFLAIVVVGAAHGLILLPVLLSICGPPFNQHRLLLREASRGSSRALIAWLARGRGAVENKAAI